MNTVADSAFLEEEHHLLRQSVRSFVRDRLVPHVDRWEKERSFPREIYADLGRAGFLGVGFPESFGGAGGDLLHTLIVAEELTRSGSPGLAASLGTVAIAAPPILHSGTDEQKARWLPRILSGEWISALAITEPGTGSDVAAIQTRAVRDGDDFVVNGTKMFITSGARADFLTVAVRTGDPGAGGISILGIETSRPGFQVGQRLEKMGWHASDTAELCFEDVRVPTQNLIGALDGGFGVLLRNFAVERLLLAVSAVAIAELAFEAARTYAGERKAFGRPIGRFQVNRHKLAEMATGIDLCRTYVYAVASRVKAGDARLAEVAMAKNAAADMACRVVDAAVQLHGGYGYMQEYLVERLYRDVRIYPIGGGTREIMNEIIAGALDL